MADVGANVTAETVGAITIPTTAAIVTPTLTTKTMHVGVDSLHNPVGVANKSTADIFAALEKAKIELMDYFADNLR